MFDRVELGRYSQMVVVLGRICCRGSEEGNLRCECYIQLVLMPHIDCGTGWRTRQGGGHPGRRKEVGAAVAGCKNRAKSGYAG